MYLKKYFALEKTVRKMPEIEVAETAGFCFGVRRAVDIAEKLGNEGANACTIGPIIHNAHVVSHLEKLGVPSVENVSAVPEGARAIIRSHGVAESVYAELKGRGIEYTDATCPYVMRIHNIVKEKFSEGFEVIMGNMYSSHYPRYESRIKKPGVVGAQISAWTTTNEEELGREGKIYDFLYTGEMLWNPCYDGRHRLSYDRILKAMMPQLRQDLRQVRYPKANHTAVLLENEASYPLSAPANTSCETDILCDSLVFEHATVEKITRIPWIQLRTVGCYEVEYADGTVESVPLTYGGNISHWNRRQNEPFRGGYYRHNGYSGTYYTDAEESKGVCGENISVYRYEWPNPKPETPIRSIRLRQYEGQPTVFTHRITAVKE